MLFKKGDVAILRNCKKYPHLNGEAVIIAGEIEMRIGDDGETVYGHELTLKCDGIARFATDDQLKKAPSPCQADRLMIGHWSDCAWSPYQNMDCMRLAKELVQVRDRTAALRRRMF
jgi:hypothetical protein